MPSYKKSPHLIEREIRGERVLIPLNGSTARFDELFSLNDTASVVWEAAGGGKSIEETAALLAGLFDIDTATARRDAEEIVDEFVRRRLLLDAKAET